jgi:hypothetical protein
MARSQDPRKPLPAQRGARRLAGIGRLIPGDEAEIVREIERIWWAIRPVAGRPADQQPAEPGVGVTVETLFLSSITGSVTSSTVLASGYDYHVSVQGTWSYWNHALEVGVPESDAMFSTGAGGRASTEVGVDAECYFAYHDLGTGNTLGHPRNFKINVGHGYEYVEPSGGQHVVPTDGHLYQYRLSGAGAAVSFKVADINSPDNYGKLKIVIQTLGPSGSGGVGGGDGTGSLLPAPTSDGALLRVAAGIPAWEARPDITEDDLDLSDVDTGDVSSSRHGFAPKAPGDTGKFLRGDGAWAAASVPGQIFLTAAGMWPSTTSGCAGNVLVESASNKQNVYLLDFADGSTQYAEGFLAMPSDWDGGTLTATFYWLADDATADAVVWDCQARAYGDGDAIDQAWGTAQTVTDANASTASELRISSATAAITVGGTPAASKLVLFRVGRLGADVSDTLTVDARLLGVMVAYTRA